MTSWKLSYLDARDRALFSRFFLGPESRRASQMLWRGVTHAGGFWCSVAAAGIPLLACCDVREAAKAASITLAVSHIAVQILKRSCGRPRPCADGTDGPLIAEPDQFSFPSGHACASMAVALAYALAFPALSLPLIAFATIVGFSRVCLGVHYPGDVLIGQLIAAVTAISVWAF